MRLKKTSLKLTSPISHLLVDLDGTLLGANDFSMRVEFTAKALLEMRKHGTWMKALKAMRSMYTELGTPSKSLTNGERAIHVFSKLMGLPLNEAERTLNEAIQILFPTMERHFYPIQGAKEFLQWAKERYLLILATNPVWTEDIVKLRMHWAKIDPSLFQSITHSGRMHACKPSTEYYQEILEQENLKYTECFLIGNDIKKDLPAARIGIPVFILAETSHIQALKIHEQKAPAWKGSFTHLKDLLANT